MNNIVECNFDGGDCCGPNVNTAYCNQCQCLTGDNGVTTLQPSTTTSPSKIINSSNGLIKLFCNIIFIFWNLGCHSTNPDIWTCCSIQNPCKVDEGDCDSDTECLGNHFCGTDNCPNGFPSSADCCEDGGTTTSPLTTIDGTTVSGKVLMSDKIIYWRGSYSFLLDFMMSKNLRG